MEIKNTEKVFYQNKNSVKGENLAKEMIIFADKNTSAVSKVEFQEKLNKLEKLSAQDLIKFIRSFDKDESIIELICDEIGSTDKIFDEVSKKEINIRQYACKKVLNALVNKAKDLGIDTFDFDNQFKSELNFQFRKIGFINTEKLDSIINALTQAIENRQNLTAEDVQTVQNTPAAEGQEQANGVIENRLEKAYSAFGERVGEDGEMTTKDKNGNLYNGQMQRDGLAADTADAIKKIFGSENTADKVRKDLKATNAQLQQLKEAKAQGEEAYKAKFKEIFGIEYDYANMVSYQKAEATYINASSNHKFEMMFNRTLKTLLSPAPLREEVRYDNPDPMTNMVTTTVTATKEEVYSREFNNLAEFLTQKDSNGNEIKGSEILNAAFEEKGVANGTIEEKFEVLKQIAKTLSKELHTATLEAGGGREFSEVQAMYDNSYKAAYGVENDIMKRVTDYNVSQEVGGAFTKMGAVILTTLATAGFGGGLVAMATATSIATVGYEVIDRGTSGNALNTLREQGLGEYLDTVKDDIDWEATLKQAAMAGGAVLIGGGVAQGVTAIMKGSSTVAQFAAMLGADIITDATMELFTTKQITWQNMVFTVLISTITNAVQLSQMKNAANAADARSPKPEEFVDRLRNADISDFEAKFNAAHSTDELEDLVRNATTVEELDFLISKFDRQHVVNNVRIENIVEDAINKKNILNGTGSKVVDNTKNGFGHIKTYDNNGNLIETKYLFDGNVIDEIKVPEQTPPVRTAVTQSANGVTTNTAAKATTQAEYKNALLNAETPYEFNQQALQTWADDMNLTLQIVDNGKSSRKAYFRDKDGNIVRTINEDSTRRGFVYDDRIHYYENGKQVSGKTKYYDDPYATTYDVSSSGDVTNKQKVYMSSSTQEINSVNTKTILMTAETPTEFNTQSLQVWADQNGFNLSFDKGIGTSRVALFTDNEGNVVRRITENNYNLGTVYDDLTIYYEYGNPICKKVKYYDEPSARFYDYNHLTNSYERVQ